MRLHFKRYFSHHRYTHTSLIMSINLSYVEGTNNKIKIRSTLYTENTLRKLCKPKDQNNIVYETDCSNCEAVYFVEFKQFLKLFSDEHERSDKNCNGKNNKIAKLSQEADHNFSWDQKKVVDRENRLIPGKIKKSVSKILISLISYIGQLLLNQVHNFYCFHPGLYIFYKNVASLNILVHDVICLL